jgi:hypothetical protein
VANTISKAAILAAALFFAISALWQALETACAPVAHYGACQAVSYFNLNWLYEYQTLVAALIALAGAWWGVSAINRQILQTEQFEQTRLASKRAASRSVLPLTLSAICDYAEDCVRTLQNLLEKCESGLLPESVNICRIPDIQPEALGAIKEMTEAARPHERDTLSSLVEAIQIQRSKMRRVLSERRGNGQPVLAACLEGYIVDSAEVYARSSGLLLYSRRLAEIPQATVTANDVERALRNLHIYDDDGPIAERVKRQFQ